MIRRSLTGAVCAKMPAAITGAIMAAALACAAGCGEVSSRAEQVYWYAFPSDLVAAGKVKAQAVPGPELTVSVPSVRRQNQEIVVSGTVTRTPNSTGDIPGFLDVQVIGPAGTTTNSATVHWEPGYIPTAGTRTARYEARLVGVPEDGSIVRVAYALRPKEAAASTARRETPAPPPSRTAVAAREPDRDAVRWAPATEAIHLGDAQVRILSADIRAPEFQAAPPGSPEAWPSAGSRNASRKLLITVEIRNTSDSAILNYSTWATPNYAYLSDTGATTVRIRNLAGATPSATIPPAVTITDVLAFDPPDPKPRSIRLELLGIALRESGEARFEIPLPYPPIPGAP